MARCAPRTSTAGCLRLFDVELVTLAGPETAGGCEPDHRRRPCERQVPKSAEHAARELALERDAGTVVTDIAMSELYRRYP